MARHIGEGLQVYQLKVSLSTASPGSPIIVPARDKYPPIGRRDGLAGGFRRIVSYRE